MQMDAGLDTGDMLLKDTLPIGIQTPPPRCTMHWPIWVRR
jgi:hypothetical protein